jgi:hypothetical protein
MVAPSATSTVSAQPSGWRASRLGPAVPRRSSRSSLAALRWTQRRTQTVRHRPRRDATNRHDAVWKSPKIATKCDGSSTRWIRDAYFGDKLKVVVGIRAHLIALLPFWVDSTALGLRPPVGPGRLQRCRASRPACEERHPEHAPDPRRRAAGPTSAPAREHNVTVCLRQRAGVTLHDSRLRPDDRAVLTPLLTWSSKTQATSKTGWCRP